jgi:hypothetical protein
MSLTNKEFNDRELLFIIFDCTVGSGYASTAEIAEALGRNGDGKRDVSSRMAWMVRFKFCKRHPSRPGHYKLTEAGLALMEGKIDGRVGRALDQMSEGDRLLVMRAIAKPTFSSTSSPAQDALRREFEHHRSNGVRRRRSR